MNQSAEQNKIIVNYKQGLCGEFICSLIQSLHGDTDLSVGKNGHCHGNRKVREHWVHDELTVDNADTFNPALHNFPAIKSHVSDINTLLKGAKGYPIIRIVHFNSPWGTMRAARNIVYKAIISEWDSYGKSDYERHLVELKSIGYNSNKTPPEMSTDELDYLIYKLAQFTKNSWSDNLHPDVYYLDLFNIYSRQDIVLELLEKLTGIKAGKDTVTFYNKYLEAQP